MLGQCSAHLPPSGDDDRGGPAGRQCRSAAATSEGSSGQKSTPGGSSAPPQQLWGGLCLFPAPSTPLNQMLSDPGSCVHQTPCKIPQCSLDPIPSHRPKAPPLQGLAELTAAVLEEARAFAIPPPRDLGDGKQLPLAREGSWGIWPQQQGLCGGRA
ncbi:TBC1 domain family member 2A [Platysternon megacephalum]|uniref:TBC1 domain family member 2A n=1 Tax=Platysternon megacephalum TaxID=55544 RepID=A0A4D9DN85_9SAUR|nr:TBC1 domain family member 2A [Platysternon megacephalum]